MTPREKYCIIEPMRKKVSEKQMALRREIAIKLREFKEYFAQPTSKKMRYLEELGMYHFHKYALRNTYGLTEYEYRKWMQEDAAFAEACHAIRQQFIDECEYLMLCRAGYYGADYQKSHIHIDNRAMSDFVKIARGYGIFRKYSGPGGTSKIGPAKGLPAGGEGDSGPVSEAGAEGSVCSVSETDTLS